MATLASISRKHSTRDALVTGVLERPAVRSRYVCVRNSVKLPPSSTFGHIGHDSLLAPNPSLRSLLGESKRTNSQNSIAGFFFCLRGQF